MSPAAVNTAPKQQIGRPFEPGQSGNPTGRPKGARNKLSEVFLQALADDFETHGKDTIVKVRTDRPNEYLRIVAMALPRRMEIEDATPDKPMREMTDDELEAIIWRTQKQLEEMGVEKPLTEDDLAQARARRLELALGRALRDSADPDAKELYEKLIQHPALRDLVPH